jgi:competence protein ComEC
MIGMVLGSVPVAVLPQLPPLQLAALAGAAAVACLWRAAGWLLLGGYLAGFAWAVAYGHDLLDARLDPACSGRVFTLLGRIDSLPQVTALGGDRLRQRARVTVLRRLDGDAARCGRPSRLLLTYYGEELLAPGEQWLFQARLRYPWGLANPGGFNRQRWLSLARVDATGSIRSSGLRRLSGDSGFAAVHHRLRAALRQRIAAQVAHPEARAVLQALSVGDKSGITAALWRQLQLLGINHLVVISGLHIGLAAALGWLLGGIVGQLARGGAHRGPLFGALLAGTGYALLAGMSLSTRRALVMLLAVCLARLLCRQPTAWRGLLLAAAGLLLMNPLAPLSAGFWLSFGAVAALLWLAGWQQRVSRPHRALAAHGYLGLVMAAPGALLFGGASLLATLSNLLLVPLVGGLLVPLVLLLALLSLLLPGMAGGIWSTLGDMLGVLLDGLQAVQPTLARWGWRELHAAAGAPLLYLVGAALLLVRGLRGRMLLVLPALLPLWLGRVPHPPAGLEVTVFDVGQGTAVVLRAAGRTLVYDTGGGDPQGQNVAGLVLVPWLRGEGIERLDQLVVSHADRDHSAGVAALFDNFEIGELWRGSPVEPGALRPGRPCAAGQAWIWREHDAGGPVTFRFLSPGGDEIPASSNNQSCVLQVEHGGYRLLFPGDIDAQRERELIRYWRSELRSDWLLIGHHGSSSSTSAAWLKWVRPREGVLSHGYANGFGHPHPAVVQRLARKGVDLHSTAREGALRFSVVGGRLVERGGWRSVQRRYWH